MVTGARSARLRNHSLTWNPSVNAKHSMFYLGKLFFLHVALKSGLQSQCKCSTKATKQTDTSIRLQKANRGDTPKDHFLTPIDYLSADQSPDKMLA